MKKTLLSACSLIALAAFPAHDARAEMMDYASLQDLFGEAVTTAATGTPQKAGDVATNMTIITQDQIRQAGTRDIPSIIGMYVSGIDVLHSSRQGFEVGMRGYQQPNMRRLLVLIDGRQVFIDDYSRTIWESLPVNPDDIRQIEVMKGASSALFGSNAAGGVVNIITKNPLFDVSNVASVTVGTHGLASGDATATTKIGSGGVKISAGGLMADEYGSPRIAAERAIQTDPERRYVVASGTFQINPKVQTFFEGTYSRSDNQAAALSGGIWGTNTKNASFRGGWSWQSPWGVISNNNYLNKHNVTVQGSDIPVRFSLKTDLVVSQLEDQFKIGANHTFRAALEYRNRKFNFDYADPTFNVQNPEMIQNNYAGGITWLWNATDKLAFTNALRLDHLDMEQTGVLGLTSIVSDSDSTHSINELSANSGITYKATEKDMFRVTYGRGVQMPSMLQSAMFADLPTGVPNVFADVQGNPDVKPTIVQNYEIGYDRELPSIKSKARFSVYYQLNQDLIGADPTMSMNLAFWPNILLSSQQINVGSSRGWGGEIELSGKSANGFRWNGSYSLAHVADSEMAKPIMAYDHSAPEHHVNLGLGYTYKKFEMDVNTQIATSTMMTRFTGAGYTLASTEGYMAVGGRVGYNVTDNFVVALSGTNLNREETKTSAFPAIERQAMLTFTGKF